MVTSVIYGSRFHPAVYRKASLAGYLFVGDSSLEVTLYQDDLRAALFVILLIQVLPWCNLTLHGSSVGCLTIRCSQI